MHYYIVGTEKQYRNVYDNLKLQIPKEVLDLLYERVLILEKNYGADRDLEKDLGGYCVVFPDGSTDSQEEYQALLDKHCIQPELYEYRDQIGDGENLWTESLYIVSSDYCVIFFCSAELNAGGCD